MSDLGGAWLANLRRWRNRSERDLSIAAEVEAQARAARAQARGVDAARAAVGSVVPDGLRAGARVVSLRRGVLTLEAPDPASLYAMDRWLRNGGEGRIRESAPAVARVRLVLVGRSH